MRELCLAVLICALCAVLLYALLSLLLPPARHRRVTDPETRSFDPASCYRACEGSERVLCIYDNQEALLWRLRMISQARHRIILSTYDLQTDHSGSDVLSALYAAGERGVQVTVLVDGLNGLVKLRGSPRFRAFASQPNLTVKFYNEPGFLHLWRANFCLHCKYLIVDDWAYLLGGRNTFDIFLGEYTPVRNLDRELLVYETEPGTPDTSLTQLLSYYDSVWSLPCCRNVVFRARGRAVERERTFLCTHYAQLLEQWPEVGQPTDYRGCTMAVHRITLLSNPVRPACREPKLWYCLTAMMAGARDVILQSPYLVCSRQMYRDLTRVCAGGTHMSVITNAAESGANPPALSDYKGQKNKLRRTGVTLYEYLHGVPVHTKAVLVDDRMTLLGSCNVDMRSVYLDTELMLAVDCRELNRQFRARAQADQARSRQVLPDGRETLGPDCLPVVPGPGVRLRNALLRLLLRPFRYLL